MLVGCLKLMFFPNISHIYYNNFKKKKYISINKYERVKDKVRKYIKKIY